VWKYRVITESEKKYKLYYYKCHGKIIFRIWGLDQIDSYNPNSYGLFFGRDGFYPIGRNYSIDNADIFFTSIDDSKGYIDWYKVYDTCINILTKEVNNIEWYINRVLKDGWIFLHDNLRVRKGKTREYITKTTATSTSYYFPYIEEKISITKDYLDRVVEIKSLGFYMPLFDKDLYEIICKGVVYIMRVMRRILLRVRDKMRGEIVFIKESNINVQTMFSRSR
jgi:hypothetical protein